MKKILISVLLFVLCSGLVLSQEFSQKKSTLKPLFDNPVSITSPGYDNIMTFLLQDFEGSTFPPAGWTNSGTATWSRTTDASGFGIGTASALADFYSISTGGTLNLITPVFAPSVSGDSLRFDHAYATYQTEVDQLQIYTSSNGGSTWTVLITLAGGVSGPLTTAPPTTNLFVPTASQWATKKYALPVGTNMIKFTGVSAYGNELYLDNILIGTPYVSDVAVTSIDAPKSYLTPGTVSPKVTVKNWGTSSQSFPVTITINPGGYTATQNVTNLAPNATQQLTFSNWTAALGSYSVTAYTQLSTDLNKSNDTLKINSIVSNVTRNVLLEYCTGTWCQWCPCGATTAHTLELANPGLIVLAYHGSGTDPWINFNGNGILGALGLNAYPTGIIDRQNSPGDYTTWTSLVNNRFANSPVTPISIVITNKSYNSSTGLLSVTANLSTICNLTDAYSVNFVIMENNLVYAQTGNSTCPGNTTFVHNHVVRNIVNGMSGETVNSGTWNAGQTITKTFSTTINSAWIAANCELVLFVYKGTTPTNSAEIQNALKTTVLATGINGNTNNKPDKFELSQNYPNPFNPTTNFKFSIPKNGETSLKIYNIDGKEMMTMFSGYMEAGYYNATLDGSKLSSGVYFYKLISDNFSETKKMVLIK